MATHCQVELASLVHPRRFQSKAGNPRSSGPRVDSSTRLGYRFKLHVRGLVGTPDLVFPRRKKVIFVNGRWRSRRIDHRACFRLTTSTDSEPSPRARLDEGGPGQSIFGYLVRACPEFCVRRFLAGDIPQL